MYTIEQRMAILEMEHEKTVQAVANLDDSLEILRRDLRRLAENMSSAADKLQALMNELQAVLQGNEPKH